MGPISALVHALKEVPGLPPFTLEDYEEESMGTSDEADAICFVRIKKDSSSNLKIGIGTDPNVIQAAAKAVINGLNALL